MDNSEWTITIKPKSKFFDLKLGEVLSYRDLILLFVKRDFVAYYQQTLLGPLWYLIQPLFSTVVFSVVFGIIAKIPTDGVPGPLFYLGGLTIWNFFSSCLSTSSDIFVANAGIFGKVYFPRLCVPISIIFSNVFKFTVQFLLFIAFLVYYTLTGSVVHPNVLLLMIPVLLIQVALLSFGFGILISSLTTKYRDLKFLIGFGMQLWMYATPIVYPISQIPEKWQWVMIVNPMSSVVELFKFAFIGSGNVVWSNYFVSLAMTAIVLLLGLLMFSKVEKTFMDKV